MTRQLQETEAESEAYVPPSHRLAAISALVVSSLLFLVVTVFFVAIYETIMDLF